MHEKEKREVMIYIVVIYSSVLLTLRTTTHCIPAWRSFHELSIRALSQKENDNECGDPRPGTGAAVLSQDGGRTGPVFLHTHSVNVFWPRRKLLLAPGAELLLLMNSLGSVLPL